MEDRSYIAIDLKSFYASVECVERGVDPLTTNLVVADQSRTEKTICLAVSPSLKRYGVSGRARLFEVVQIIKKVNEERKDKVCGKGLTGCSVDSNELINNPFLEVDYIVAKPRMALYSDYSRRIYEIYLKYFSEADILNYSIDEVILDATPYLKISKKTAYEYAKEIVAQIYAETGITATVGIGTNMYLCKVAMDIVAKHINADAHGVHIACLDEMLYRQKLWNHKPLTDFWRIGRGIAKKLEENGLYTMGDIAKCSLGNYGEFYNEGLLYKLFGVNAELIIDHAWGWEPCTIKEAKNYKPKNNSICSGQVLQDPYTTEKARLIVQEMTDVLVLEIVDKGLLTDQIVLTVGYDVENLTNEMIKSKYKGDITEDFYGRYVPKHAHGTANLGKSTSSTKEITKAVLDLYDSIINKDLLVRRINVSFNKLVAEKALARKQRAVQLNLLDDLEYEKNNDKEIKREKKVQKAVIGIKKKYGKNSILKGMNFCEGATTKDRNEQIGGHKA